MSKISERLSEWARKNRAAFDRLGLKVEIHWIESNSPNQSAYLDGQTGKTLFRIVAWELGQTELQILRSSDGSFEILETEADGRDIETRLNQHLITISNRMLSDG